MRMLRSIFALAFLLAAGLSARAASSAADAPHVHVQLVVPGSALTADPKGNDAGLYFKLESGWHVYWMNAGDAGEPPRIKWTLPAGITAGPLLFPAPGRIPYGPFMDFGYEDEVLFPLKLQVATTAAGPASLHAHVSWLVCRSSCVPGRADLEVDRRINPQAAHAAPIAEDAALFSRLSGRIPRDLPSEVKANFEPTAAGFRVHISTGRKETQAAFFPADQNVIDDPAPQQLVPTAKGLTLDLKTLCP
jgi:DsbC/DsbD-like thiol-disulfide interchange protein